MENFIKLVADTPEEIRRMDVYRLLTAAKDKGVLDELVQWMSDRRCELKWGVWEEAKVILEEWKNGKEG